MFLFDSIPWYSWVAWLVVLGALIGVNELTRRYRYAAWAVFIVLPVVLTVFVWPTTAGAGSSTGTWFHWARMARVDHNFHFPSPPCYRIVLSKSTYSK